MSNDGVAIWLGIYEQWEADPEPVRAAGWVEQLATVAILHGLPCYEDGVENAGAAGWRRLVGKYEGGGVFGQEVRREASRDERDKTNGRRQTASDAPRALPWVANDRRQTSEERHK